eukprot:6662415-Pyramimonas_sp.AAC.1
MSVYDVQHVGVTYAHVWFVLDTGWGVALGAVAAFGVCGGGVSNVVNVSPGGLQAKVRIIINESSLAQ